MRIWLDFGCSHSSVAFVSLKFADESTARWLEEMLIEVVKRRYNCDYLPEDKRGVCNALRELLRLGSPWFMARGDSLIIENFEVYCGDAEEIVRNVVERLHNLGINIVDYVFDCVPDSERERYLQEVLDIGLSEYDRRLLEIEGWTWCGEYGDYCRKIDEIVQKLADLAKEVAGGNPECRGFNPLYEDLKSHVKCLGGAFKGVLVYTLLRYLTYVKSFIMDVSRKGELSISDRETLRVYINFVDQLYEVLDEVLTFLRR